MIQLLFQLRGFQDLQVVHIQDQVAIISGEILTQRRLQESPVTLEDLSGVYNVSRERIRQIEVRAFEKLQKRMKDLAREKGMAAPA